MCRLYCVATALHFYFIDISDEKFMRISAEITAAVCYWERQLKVHS